MINDEYVKMFYYGARAEVDGIFYIPVDSGNMDTFSDTFVPLSFVRLGDGRIYVKVVRELEEKFRGFVRDYRESLLEPTVFPALFEELTPALERLGLYFYTGNNEIEKLMYLWAAECKNREKYLSHIEERGIIRGDTVMFRACDNKVNITNSYLGYSGDRQYFGTETDGRIVSICGTNIEYYKYPGIISVEIGVDTHSDHRERGYAKSNTAAMTKWLLSLGHNVLYRCNSLNTASINNAKSVGLDLFASEKMMFALKKE